MTRFELAAEPLWRGDAGGLPEIMTAGWVSARFIDDVLFLEQGTSTMAAVNPTTGEPYWTADSDLLVGNSPKYGDVSLQNSTGGAPVSRVGSEWAMFLSYNTEGADIESWTAAVRVKDASALWRVPRAADVYDIVAADDRIVLLSLGARLDRPAARAISTTDGATLWETPDLWAQFVAGDRVLGAVSSQPPELAADDSYVVGLDAATGQQVWSLEGQYQRSEVRFVAGDVALVYVGPAPAGNPDWGAIVLIDVATGAEITKVGWTFGGGNTCASDEGRLIACTVSQTPKHPSADSAQLVTFDVAQRTKHVSPRERAKQMDAVSVKKIWHDYIFVLDSSEATDVMLAVDRDGIVVSDKLPGTLTGISDEYAAFALPGRSIPVVYQLKK